MAVPKRKTSKSRRDKRRSHHKILAANILEDIMNNKIIIAVDAMGCENSPKKVIEGINISNKRNKKNFFFLYGNKNLIENYFDIHKDVKPYCEVIHSEDEISDEESPLVAAKKKSKTNVAKELIQFISQLKTN